MKKLCFHSSDEAFWWSYLMNFNLYIQQTHLVSVKPTVPMLLTWQVWEPWPTWLQSDQAEDWPSWQTGLRWGRLETQAGCSHRPTWQCRQDIATRDSAGRCDLPS